MNLIVKDNPQVICVQITFVPEFLRKPTFISSECRHRLFSNHFGDAPPTCANNCDICANKNEVEDMIHNFHVKSIQYSSEAQVHDMSYDEDLYEGGRRKQKE